MPEAGETLSSTEQAETVTPEELARQINAIPNPTADVSRLILEESKKPFSERRDPGEITAEYIDHFKSGGHKLVSSDQAIRMAEPCLDCGERVMVGQRILDRVGNPDDIDIRQLVPGVVRVTIKPNPSEPVKSAGIPLLVLHGMERHGKYSMESRAWGQEQEAKKVELNEIISVLNDDLTLPTSDK